MPRFKTYNFKSKYSDGTIVDYKFQINISMDGIFTCTIPPDAAGLLQSMGITLQKNRSGNDGFYSSETMDGLIKSISSDFLEAFSRELVEDIVVIKYWINTRCSYGRRSDGEVIPNLSHEWVKGEGGLKWRQGTQDMDSRHTDSYGIDVAVKLKNKKTYRYRSGVEKVEYSHVAYIDDRVKDFYKDDYDFQFLKGLTGMSIPSSEYGKNKATEIPYDPDMAKLLVNLIKSIVEINEKIKPIITDQSKLLEVAKESGKLLMR